MSQITSPVLPNTYECTITTDCAVFGFQNNRVKLLLVKRSIEPYKGYWMLPGGVMHQNQTLEESIDQVLFELTGIQSIHKNQVGSYSSVDRHPVKRVVTVCFYALVKPENHLIIAKNHISDVVWCSLDELPDLGFDHKILAMDAWTKLRANVEHHLTFGELLPEKFTLKELQDLFESILGQTLDRRNFRKRMLQLNLLRPTHEKKKGVKGGPELFRIKR